MTSLQFLQAAIAFVSACCISLVLMPAARILGLRLGCVVAPRLFGVGRPSVSYLGGTALALAVCGAFGISARGLPLEASQPLLAGFVLLIFGLVDDHASRRGGGLSPTIRVVVEVWAAVALWWTGLRPQLLGNVWLDAIVVVIFLVACVNAFNLLDNMDGVAGATAAATAAGLFGLACLSGQPEVAWLAAAVSGGALGFLRHNLVAARIFLGNGGTLFLGFVIGALALRLRVSAEPPWSLLAAVAALGIPVMDTSIVIVSRLRARRSPFKGGVDHLSHRLVRLGFTSRSAALLHATGAALGGVVAFLAVLFSRMEPIAGVIGAFGIAAVLFLKMTIYESDPIEGDAPGIGISLVPDVGDGETSAEKSTLAPEEAT